ncbi:MAG: HU family DNA-binding protein [Puniceicoccales bacterium]|jgi:DNA-binding protein HU-beta|nr:HU family DNA-binding protein [Puniceicoccales bacterium]
MNKSELVTKAHAIVGDDVSRTTVDRVLGAIITAIKDSVAKRQSVQLIGFGTFDVVKRAKRQGVNPKTREKIVIEEKYAVKFKPGSDLRRTV